MFSLEPIQICMLGDFTLRAGDQELSSAGNRSKKVWSLLAYLICNRGRSFSQQKLIDLLWEDDAASTNPENALRITLHRLRNLLDQLWPGAGKELIVRQEGGYAWNPTVPVTVDSERFDALSQAACEEENQRLTVVLEALSLYKGEFLARQAGELWVIPISTHLQNQYLQLTLEAAQLLSAREDHAEAARLCRQASQSEPYHEELHQILIRELAAAGDAKGASAVYDGLSKRLFEDFGIRPNEQTRQVYRTAVHIPEDRALPMDEVLEYLQEPEGNTGAMQCDYDYFKVLCYAESRAMERSGTATHIALLSMAGDAGKPLTKRSVNRIMEQLGEVLRGNLRRGDTISRCSTTQYIIMLPNANYENSCMVCRRVIAAFTRAHPHVSAKLHFMVQPLSPGISVP